MARRPKPVPAWRSRLASRLDFQYLAAFVLGAWMFWLSGQSGGYVAIQYLPQSDVLANVVILAFALFLFAAGMTLYAWVMLGRRRRAAKPALLAGMTVISLALFATPVTDRLAGSAFIGSDQLVIVELLTSLAFASFYVIGWSVARYAARH